MTAIISDKIKRHFLDRLFNEATGTRIGDSDNYYYIGIGRSQTWQNDGLTDVTVSPSNHEREERTFRYNLQSVKAVEAFSYVVPVDEWSANTQYTQYNDNVVGTPAVPYFVRTNTNNVYLCIRTGKDELGNVQVSTVKPDHTDTSLPIETDGYVWKYMYTISVGDANSFLTSTYMPVKLIDSAAPTDPYYAQSLIQAAAVPGQIIGYRVANGGQGYDSSDTVTVVGNGSGAKARLVVSSGVITAVEVGDSANVGNSGYPSLVSAMGSGYDYANIRITSAGGNDSAEIIPIFAHENGLGADPREDLRATAMMFHIKPEGTVNDTFVTGNQDYRQVGLIKNIKDSAGGTTFTGTSGIALNRLTVTSTIPFAFDFSDNIKMTGDSNATAWIDYIEDSTIWYHQDEFTGFTPFRSGETIDIASGTYTRTVDLHNIAPNVDKYSGDVYFVSNDAAQPRTTASTDDIKLVIQL